MSIPPRAREIAKSRDVSLDTVRSQVSSIYSKVGISKANQLANLVSGLGLVGKDLPE